MHALGAGLFGKVLEGNYNPQNGTAVPCALKKLKTEEASNHKTEILREADAMAALDHPHIIRLIGIQKMIRFYTLCIKFHNDY